MPFSVIYYIEILLVNGILALNSNITTIHIDPSIKSPYCIFFKSLEIDIIISNRVVPVAFMPKMSLIWDAMMSIVTAEVNPAFTGPEIKSIRKPAKKRMGMLMDEIMCDK